MPNYHYCRIHVIQHTFKSNNQRSGDSQHYKSLYLQSFKTWPSLRVIIGQQVKEIFSFVKALKRELYSHVTKIVQAIPENPRYTQWRLISGAQFGNSLWPGTSLTVSKKLWLKLIIQIMKMRISLSKRHSYSTILRANQPNIIRIQIPTDLDWKLVSTLERWQANGFSFWLMEQCKTFISS